MVFVNNNNFGHVTLNLATTEAYLKAVPNEARATEPPTTADGGLCVALDAWDGAIKWSFTNPKRDQANRNAWSLNPITLVNGVVMYASMDPTGELFMLRAENGQLLAQYTLGASSACGPAVVDGVVYTGTGYSNFALGAAGTKVMALTA
jgi:polyvinyl alcohol dehydrogenase (cytochrome)